jgi:hypothetical protein
MAGLQRTDSGRAQCRLILGRRREQRWKGRHFHPDTVRGGHAICIVGYRADGRFIVRNSWGTAWGDEGFGYLHPGYIKSAFFDESYGVTL